jgi:hypothetical protein
MGKGPLGMTLLLMACAETPSEPVTDGSASDRHRPVADSGLERVDAKAGDLQGPDGKIPVDECLSSKPDWIFCSGFEEGNLSTWDDYDGNPSTTNQLIAEPGPSGAANNHVMRLRVPPGRGGADLVKVLPSQHDKLYARWYIKWEKGYDFSAGNHGSGLHAGDRDLLGRSDYRPHGDDWYTAWVEPLATKQLNIYTYYRGMYMDCSDPDGSCWGDHFPCMVGALYCTNPAHLPRVQPPVLQDDTWYCIELMIDGGSAVTSAGAADGVLDFWVDNVEIGPWDKMWFRTDANLKLSILWLNLFHHADHSVEGVMLDNVVVSTSRVGCL